MRAESLGLIPSHFKWKKNKSVKSYEIRKWNWSVWVETNPTPSKRSWEEWSEHICPIVFVENRYCWNQGKHMKGEGGWGVGGGGRNIKLSNEIPNLHTTRPQTTEEGKKIHIQRCCWSNSPAPKLSYYVLKHCWLLIHTNPKVGRNYIDVLCYNFSDTWQKMISRKSCNKDGKWNNWK